MSARWRIELLGWLRASYGSTDTERSTYPPTSGWSGSAGASPDSTAAVPEQGPCPAVVPFRSQKSGALLGYLAYHHRRSHPREELIELLWPECDPEVGRHRLRKALSSLRQQFEPPGAAAGAVILADRLALQLNPDCLTDVAEFEAALHAAGRAGSSAERVRLLAQAVELHRGPLLPGYYDDWIMPERRRLEELFFQALRQLVTLLEQSGEMEFALQYAHRAVSVDPLREEACLELMRLYAAAGQPGAALRQYRELERLLQQELNATPGAALCALAREIQEEWSAGRGFQSNVETWGHGEWRGKKAEEEKEEAGVVGSFPFLSPASPCPSASPGLHGLSEASAARRVVPARLEPVGGAVPLDSEFYIVRRVDQEFAAAIARQDSIVLVKGTRQVGKTSLLARGLQQARQAGARVLRTDFEIFNSTHLHSAESLLLTLAQTIADQLDLEVSPSDVWDTHRSPNHNFRRFLDRQLLDRRPTPLVWSLDQVDRLFGCPFGPEVFALFRSWHNERALDPAGPWSRLTLAIAYATEAHLFITDLDQSPFNVGTRLTLEEFTLEQVAELDRRYGSPLKDNGKVARFYGLVGGHPYLVRRGLHELASHGTDIAVFEARASSGDWIFGDHLRRILVLLTRAPELCEAVRTVLAGRPCPSLESFYRLRSAGVVAGESEREARLRCQLYATYLRRHLH